MTKYYETACEFLDEADYHGGLAEFILSCDVHPDAVPHEETAVAIADLRDVVEDLKNALKRWHGDDCEMPDYWDEEDGEYQCPGI